MLESDPEKLRELIRKLLLKNRDSEAELAEERFKRLKAEAALRELRQKLN